MMTKSREREGCKRRGYISVQETGAESWKDELREIQSERQGRGDGA
jgi:hypothetical protein